MWHFSWPSFRRYWQWVVIPTIRHPWERDAWKRLGNYTVAMLLYGFAGCDIWSLDYTIAEFVLPRLELFRQYPGGQPGNMTQDEYEAILDKMLVAFRLIAANEVGPGLWNPQDGQKVQEGLELFGEYFQTLWN